MKIKLDEWGCLAIERNGYFVSKFCPYSQPNGICCGDWCPKLVIKKDISRDNRFIINICGTIFRISDRDFLDLTDNNGS